MRPASSRRTSLTGNGRPLLSTPSSGITSGPAGRAGRRPYDERMGGGAGPQDGLEITSPANPRIKQLVALRHRRARDRAGVTLVEGYEELDLALSAGVRPLTLYVCPDLAGDATQPMTGRVAGLGAEVIRVSRPVFA